MEIILNVIWAYSYRRLAYTSPAYSICKIVCMITTRVSLTYQMCYQIIYAYETVIITDCYKIFRYGELENSSMCYRRDWPNYCSLFAYECSLI